MPLNQTRSLSKQTNYILREGVNVFRPFLERLESKITPSCIKRITVDNYTEVAPQLAAKPMFSRYMLVYASVIDVDSKYWDFINNLALKDWVRLIITVRSRAVLDALRCHKYFKEYRVLDCYAVTKEVLENYIRTELIRYGCNPLTVTDLAVTRIRRRARFKTYVLDSVLPLLAHTNLSQRVVNSYISPYTGVTLQNIGSQFFNPKRQDAIAAYLLHYHRYISDIYRKVQNYVFEWMTLYEEFMSGRLSDETSVEWIDMNGAKYGVLYEYQAKAWLKSFSNISYEFMANVFVMLQESSSAGNNIQLGTLYRIFRMVTYIE